MKTKTHMNDNLHPSRENKDKLTSSAKTKPVWSSPDLWCAVTDGGLLEKAYLNKKV